MQHHIMKVKGKGVTHLNLKPVSQSPGNVHLIWLGGAAPDSVLAVYNLWLATDSYQVHLWTDDSIAFLGEGPWLDSKLHPAQRADLLRVKLLSHLGGWYVDVDCLPGKEVLPFPNQVLIAREDSMTFTNAFFYSPKCHPFLDYWYEELLTSLSCSSFPTIADQTGPSALGRTIHRYAMTFGLEQLKSEISSMQWNEFRHWPSHMKPIIFFPKSKYGAHVANASWVSQNPLKERSRFKTFFASLLWLCRTSQLAFIGDFLRFLVVDPVALIRMLREELGRKMLMLAEYDLPAKITPNEESINADFFLERIRVDEQSRFFVRGEGFIDDHTSSALVKISLKGEELLFLPRPTYYFKKT